MAGKEVSGVQNADDTIFHSANFIITPTAKNTQQDISCLKDLAHILEFSHISILTLEEHDTMIGFLSQLNSCDCRIANEYKRQHPSCRLYRRQFSRSYQNCEN